uniref:Uncharacterized protein n=1 Tax=Seriola dumerili TaxID=41447 RepID=A0A3B4UA93_SERDU
MLRNALFFSLDYYTSQRGISETIVCSSICSYPFQCFDFSEKNSYFTLYPSAERLQQPEESHLSTRDKVNRSCSVIFPGHAAVKSPLLQVSSSPVSYRHRLTRPSLQEKPVLLCSCSFTFPFMKLFRYSSVSTGFHSFPYSKKNKKLFTLDSN